MRKKCKSFVKQCGLGENIGKTTFNREFEMKMNDSEKKTQIEDNFKKKLEINFKKEEKALLKKKEIKEMIKEKTENLNKNNEIIPKKPKINTKNFDVFFAKPQQRSRERMKIKIS